MDSPLKLPSSSDYIQEMRPKDCHLSTEKYTRECGTDASSWIGEYPLWTFSICRGLTAFRTLSMTFGRPAMIPNDYVKLELPVDFHSLVAAASPADPLKSGSTLFFSATMLVSRLVDL